MLPQVEEYLTAHGGAAGFAALLALKIGEMIWKYFSTRDANFKTMQCALEKNTEAVLHMERDFKKFKHDLRKAFVALKTISGDKWPEIAREFDDLRPNDELQT